MRIALFADSFSPELSGIADSVTTTGAALVERGHDVLYVAPRYGPADDVTSTDSCDVDNTVRLRSVPLPRSPTGHSRIALPTGASTASIDAFRPDVVHTHAPWGTGLEAWRAARRRGVPMVGTNHTMVEAFLGCAPPVVARAVRRYDAWFYNRCALVSTPYEGLLVRMRDAGLQAPARVVPNPVRLGPSSATTAAEKQRLRRALGLEGFVVLCVGRLAREKQVDVVVRAVHRCTQSGLSMTCIATGDGEARACLQGLTEALGLAGVVRFPGRVSDAVLAMLYRASDLFVLMSVADSQSVALMDAYAFGLPAVTARANGLPDYTPPSCGFVVAPGDHEELARVMRRLARDQPLWTGMSEAGPAFAQRFAPQGVARQWEAIYADVVMASKRHPGPRVPRGE